MYKIQKDLKKTAWGHIRAVYDYSNIVNSY